MGKILGAILSVAEIVVGVVTLNPYLIAQGTIGLATVVASSISGGKGGQKAEVNAAAQDRLKLTLNPTAPRTLAFGRTALNADVRYQSYTGTNQEYYHQIVAVASHKVTSIEEIWFESKAAWSSTLGVQGTYVGYLEVVAVLEGSASNMVNIDSVWNAASNRRLTGCAYVWLKYKLTGKDSKATSPFSSSIPSRVTIIGKGMPVYDPRRDSTAGGSGTQRANDQTTWAFNVGSADPGRNAALVHLAHLLGWKIGGKTAVGRGVPPSRIDLSSYIDAANLCDEAVTLSSANGGGTEGRYRFDGVFNESEDGSAVMANIEAAMDARLRDVNGRLSLWVAHNDLSTPVLDFDEDDVLGAFSWNATGPIEEDRNIGRGRYTDARTTSLYQLNDYPQVTATSPDGIDRVLSLDYPGVQSVSQAQRLTKQTIQRNRYSGRFSAEFGARAWATPIGAVVRLTFYPLGFVNKPFRVESRGIDYTGVCPMTLREENAAIYAWAAEDAAPITLAAPIVYDPKNNPMRPPEDGANMIKDAILFSTANSPNGAFMDRLSNIAGRPADAVRARLIAANSLMRWTDIIEVPTVPDETLFYRDVVTAFDASSDTCNVSVAYYAADQSVVTAINLSSQTQVTASAIYSSVTQAWFPRTAVAVSPDNSAYAVFYVEKKGSAGTSGFGVGEAWIDRTEPGAEVPIVITPSATSMTVARNSDGTAKAGELPRDFGFHLTRGGVDVTTSTTWSTAQKAGTPPSTSTPTAASPNNTGLVSVTATNDQAVIIISAVYGGRTTTAELTMISNIDPPSSGGTSGGGGSATSVSTSAITGTSSNTYGVGNTVLPTCSTGSGGVLTFTFPGRFKRTTNGTSGAYGKWQYRAVGAGTWIDVTTEIHSSYDADKTAPGGGDPAFNSAGGISVNMVKTGLTANTAYEVQLALRNDATSTTTTWTGTAAVSGS